MLNEIYALERSLSAAGFEVAPRHADVSSPGKTETVHIRLDARGIPSEAAALGRDRVASLWTLRNGKHNSFPYIQLKRPLLAVPEDDAWRKAHGEAWKTLSPAGRRQCLRGLASDYTISAESCAVVVGSGLRESLGKRHVALTVLREPHASVPAVIARTLAIASAAQFASSLLRLLLGGLDQADDAFLEVAHVVLVGRVVQGKVTGCPLLLDVLHSEFERDVADAHHAGAISLALSGGVVGTGGRGMCLLAGVDATLHVGNFPQPTLPMLGQIYLFSKNGDVPAAHRYGRSDVAGLPVGSELVQRLAGALDAITISDREAKTWRVIPGEKRETRDLLMAFVDGVADAPVAALVAAGDTDGDDLLEEETTHLSEDERRAAAAGDARSAYTVRAERVIQALQGKLGIDFRDTRVSLLVLRKVDTGNAKAILHRALTVGSLHDAATAWADALGNVPHWLRMPVPRKAGSAVNRATPAIAPLQLPRATQSLFIRGGAERAKREPVGITAADALALFLGDIGAEQIAHASLRIVLTRQALLLTGAAQALRRDAGKDELKAARAFDRAAALQAAGLVGLLLAKIRRKRETYMSGAAFQLGQVLAAADVIHVGYCADVRGGQVPPMLLGNALLPVAQDDPIRALAMLCQRWRPYLAWVQVQADRDKAESLSKSKDAQERAKGWAIRSAISQAYHIKGIAEALASNLPEFKDTADRFRAELILGYVAGLPKTERQKTTKEESEQ